MLNTGIPSTFIHWIRSFLNDRRARVQFFNVFSSIDVFLKVYFKVPFLPFYSSCSTLTIWLLCLKMMELLPSLLITSRSSLQLIKRRCWNCYPVSSKLCCDLKPWIEIKLERQQIWGIFLLHLVQDSTWNPTIFIGTQKVRVSATPHLLSVILDRSLTFNAYLKKVATSLTSTICIIRATAHTSWGWHRSTLKMAFHALIRSKFDYAAPALALW